MKKLITLLACWVTCSVWSQTDLPNEPAEHSPQRAASIARHLQQETHIDQAVFLTQKAWQLTRSFGSDEQLAEQWQLITEQVIPASKNHPFINSRALAGQWLIQYTDGMNLDDWRLVDSQPKTLVDLSLPDLSASDRFAVFLDLELYWQDILDHVVEDSSWLQFPETSIEVEMEMGAEKSLQQVLSSLAFHDDLTTVIQTFSATEPFTPLQTALLRQSWHRQQHQTTAFFYDWVAIYQYMEFNTQLLDADTQAAFQNEVNVATQWWQSKADQIAALDHELHPLMPLLLGQLTEKFKNPDHVNPALNTAILRHLWNNPDPNNYANHPLRQNIMDQLEVCLNISKRPDGPNPPQPISLSQFNSCMDDISQWGLNASQSTPLAGKSVPLEGALAWSRVLQMPFFQSINYLAINSQISAECQQQIQTKVNPLEWSLATETLLWIHDRWPGLMPEWNNSNQLQELWQMGQNTFKQPECLQAQDQLTAQFETLKNRWQQLKTAINSHLESYRTNHLMAGSQVDFFQPANQFTQLPANDITISPCDVKNACGAFVELPASVALLDLFPNHLKMAQQLGLGEVKLCYDQVQWQNREAEPTHLNNNKIANYTGQLSLQLKGTFNDLLVFTKNMVGEDKHLYLFGENTEDVLNTACPLSIIGEQINTQLDRGTFGLFPNRLTFLTAQRTDLNHVIQKNWTEGEQWQNKLADENHSSFADYQELPEVKQQVNAAFLSHNNQVQLQVYRRLINANATRIKDSELSAAAFNFLTQRQQFQYMIMGLFPDIMFEDEIRGALKGKQRLMDESFFQRAYEQQTHILDMLNAGDQIFHQHSNLWSQISAEPQSQMLNQTLKKLSSVNQQHN